MPDISEEEAKDLLKQIFKESFPSTLRKENEAIAKEEYQIYKQDNNFKKINGLNPLTIYFIIKDLKGEDQVNFIKDNIEYISKNDEEIFIYNMIAPAALSSFLSYESIKAIYDLNKDIFYKLLNGCVETLIDGFSNEEIYLFFNDFYSEINEKMVSYKFVNLYHYAKRVIFENMRRESKDSELYYENIFLKSNEISGKLSCVLIERYSEKIANLESRPFLSFFNAVVRMDMLETEEFKNFLRISEDKLRDIYANARMGDLWDYFEDAGFESTKIIFDYFGDIIVNRSDFDELFIAINGNVLCELYKKDKQPFKNIDISQWLKFVEFNENLKYVLQDYEINSLQEILELKMWVNYKSLAVVENKFRNGIIVDGNLLEINEDTSIFSNEYVKNLKELNYMFTNKIISRNNETYRKQFNLFCNHLVKEKIVDRVNENNCRDLEIYFNHIIRGANLSDLKRFDNIKKIVLFNRVGKGAFFNPEEFSEDQLRKYNVKEHKMLYKRYEQKKYELFSYKSLTLKLLLLFGYQKAEYILSLIENELPVLEHLVGNVDVSTVEIDENSNPILNNKIINLLFKDQEHNRIESMLKDKESDLYKYFPRIFNEWEMIKLNGKDSSLNCIVGYLKSDDVCVGVKYYRLKGLFKYIGCSNEIVKDTLNLHDEMVKRVSSTIPRIKGEVSGYSYEILKLDDMEGLTVGNKTNCCFTVKGNAYSSLIHSLTNKNGRILTVKKDGKLVAHSWVWRNGNVLCLDNIETDLKEIDFIEVYEKFASEILDVSLKCEGETSCIKNVMIGRTDFDKKILDLEKYMMFVLKGEDEGAKSGVVVDKLPCVEGKDLYSDAKKRQVLVKGNGNFEYYDCDDSYLDEREDVLFFDCNNEDNVDKINDVINALRYLKYESENNLNKFKLIDVEDYKKAWCNKDWFILVDEKDNVEKYALLNDERCKNEIKNILNNTIKNSCKKTVKCV